ncbi:MAG TPA: hypothetical protein VMU59_15380 [Caulobacteraceae bacterium]|nr:hypothetical protein [Caulobacteraceae bacterium]
MSGRRARVALLAAFAAGALLAQAPARAGTADDPVLEVVQTDYHVPLFSNQYVTVVDVNIPPGRGTNFHNHRDDALNIYLVDYPPKSAGQDYGKPVGILRGGKSMPKAGEVLFQNFSNSPIINRGENQGSPGDGTMHVIETEFTGRHVFGYTPAERDPAYVKVVDNDKVAVWRLTLQPGETAPMIVQKAPGMRVVIHGGEIAEITPGAKDRGMLLTDGKVYWQDGGVRRAVKNIGATPVMLVEMEMK